MSEIVPETDEVEVEVNDIDDAGEQENTGRVIVAIPTATEPVHHLGDVSEPKHMTLVWLGKPDENPNLDMDQIREQVGAVAEQSIGPATTLVESTGQLGDDDATVWFVDGEGISPIRDGLLAQPAIKEGFDAVEQYPEWTPHVTAGYEMEEPLDEETSPDEIIFDKLAVWDGDEHTEYPLGPSAESTLPDGPEVTDEIVEELMAAFEKPIAIHDAASLAEAVTVCEGSCGTAQMASRPILMKRARELGLQHMIPTSWLRHAAQMAVKAVKPTAATDETPMSVTLDPFQSKTELSGLDDTALRAAYVRGVREFTMVAPQSRPPLPRDLVAQARVNSLIRLSQGDLSARTDDRDLLP